MVWALNTDGIDVSGTDIVVRNCTITNFDDTVCPKPRAPPCTTNFLIEDINVTYGVGISMGSVPPDVGGNCIDGVYARRATFHSALKTVYVKPNPEKFGENATGLIANITYEDIDSFSPLWWPIWIGPQQDPIRDDVDLAAALEASSHAGEGVEVGAGAEDDVEASLHAGEGAGAEEDVGDLFPPGCSFIFPINGTICPTDPQVLVRDVTLRRVNFFNPPSPGVLLMNVSTPATGFVFQDVVHHNSSGWPVSADYYCRFVSGVALGSTSPVPPCFTRG
jgi:hypothetical protein